MNKSIQARIRARRQPLILMLLATLALAVMFGIGGRMDAEYAQYEASQSYK